MPKFPKSEAGIIALAQKMVPGFQENPDFPSPPFSSSDLNNMLTALIAQIATQAANKATMQQSTAIKKTMTKDTTRVMKAMLHYAFDAVQGDDAKLTVIGWGGIAEPTPHVLVPPGQPRDLRVTQQHEDSLDIAWTVPADGGLVAFYRVEQREQTEGGKWKIASSGVDINETLTDQERGKVWEYRVIAINKAGESLPSNTVTAVL
jgi:hypothetical protein